MSNEIGIRRVFTLIADFYSLRRRLIDREAAMAWLAMRKEKLIFLEYALPRA